ncbi:AraC family transcriptional regulator [Serratia sp. M24T3]|nr:AraC family transcriptional regulator [Serratia sp. M24T3]
MLTLSRLSAVLDLANSIRMKKKRYQLILLSSKGGTVYSACQLPVESSITTSKSLIMLNSLFIMENLENFHPAWNNAASADLQNDSNHKVKYLGIEPVTIKGLTSPLFFLASLEEEAKLYHLSTFDSAMPNVNFKKESVLIFNNHVWAASGHWAGIDLILTFIEEESGAAEAMQLMNIVERLFNKYENNSQLAVLENFSCHGNSERINLSLRYIRQNLCNTVTITQLAELANLSARQFSRLFKEETSTSPAKAIAQIRAEVARNHVIQGRLSLDKIASLCGFSGVKGMRRAFLKFYGESPCNFRIK